MYVAGIVEYAFNWLKKLIKNTLNIFRKVLGLTLLKVMKAFQRRSSFIIKTTSLTI